MGYCLIGVGIFMQKTKDKCWKGCREKAIHAKYCFGMYISTAIVKAVWSILKKLKIGTSIW
jgi:hypothetical protein